MSTVGTQEIRASQYVIHLSNLRKVYGMGNLEVVALGGIDLAVATGEYVAIMGPSGSGKSTLMHILGCLDTATSGKFLLGGQDVTMLSEVELAQVRNQRIGFVFQQFNLLSTLSAWRNVELPLVYGGVNRSRRRERAMTALAQVGLESRVHHRPGELSGGQQQRVAFARALVTDPDIVLADEPTGNLDSLSSMEALGLLGNLHQSGRTIILITHDLEVASHASRIIRIRDGRLIGEPSDVQSSHDL